MQSSMLCGSETWPVQTPPFYSSVDFVQDNPGELVPEETFTHSHLSWSSIVPYLLHLSTTIHGILPVQSTCLTVFFYNLAPSFLWSTYWPGTLHFILHTFLHPIIVFFSHHITYHRNLFCCSTEIMSFNPSLSLSPLLGILFCSFTPYIHLFSSLPAEVPPQFPLLWARSHFYSTYYFAHNYCTISLSLSMIYPYW